jgi:RNA polymerase sigma-70 factor (ECF subfamily)
VTAVDDVTLVRRARDGDEAAFAELLERHQSRVYHHALRMMGNPQDAEEVLQDTFVQVFKNLERFEERSRFSTWIYRIATNESLMKLRKAHRKREVFTEDAGDRDFEGHRDEIRAFTRSVVDEVQDRQFLEILERVLQELPEEYRVVFTLRDLDELTNAEVAEILDLSIPAVKSRLHRSRLFLRDRLSRILGERKPAGDRETGGRS